MARDNLVLVKKVIQLQESWLTYILLWPSFLSSYCSCSYQVPMWCIRLVVIFLVSLHYFFLKQVLLLLPIKKQGFTFCERFIQWPVKWWDHLLWWGWWLLDTKKRQTSYSEEFVKCKSWSQNSGLHRSEHLRGCPFSKCQHF